ncbi:MAG: hypothetical protein JWM99_1796, partial [Verrucomicrobiales bacterium]|nr:hypothetical protein [Verrucomicrobiales bacterium]
NEKAYGWVMALASRDDGLFGQIKTNSSDIDYDRACPGVIKLSWSTAAATAPSRPSAITCIVIPSAPLESFAWSSYLYYLKGPKARASWLPVDRPRKMIVVAKQKTNYTC